MTVQPAAGAPVRSLSKSSLFSLIFGILSCIPFSGVLAVLLGIVGFVRTGNPLKSGRWMAVIGALLGLVGSVAWIVSGGAIIALVFGVISVTQPPADATRDFIKGLSEGDVALVEKHNGGFEEKDLQDFVDYFHAKGKFIETTLPVRSVENDKAEISGVAKFEKATLTVEARLVKKGADWRVVNLKVEPAKEP